MYAAPESEVKARIIIFQICMLFTSCTRSLYKSSSLKSVLASATPIGNHAAGGRHPQLYGHLDPLAAANPGSHRLR